MMLDQSSESTAHIELLGQRSIHPGTLILFLFLVIATAELGQHIRHFGSPGKGVGEADVALVCLPRSSGPGLIRRNTVVY